VPQGEEFEYLKTIKVSFLVRVCSSPLPLDHQDPQRKTVVDPLALLLTSPSSILLLLLLGINPSGRA
jgi:hypothetical protein